MTEFKLPRIHKGLKLADMKEEAIVRGLDAESVPKKKADLLDHLVDGSIHLKEAIDGLKKTLEIELPSLRAEQKRRNDVKALIGATKQAVDILTKVTAVEPPKKKKVVAKKVDAVESKKKNIIARKVDTVESKKKNAGAKKVAAVPKKKVVSTKVVLVPKPTIVPKKVAAALEKKKVASKPKKAAPNIVVQDAAHDDDIDPFVVTYPRIEELAEYEQSQMKIRHYVERVPKEQQERELNMQKKHMELKRKREEEERAEAEHLSYDQKQFTKDAKDPPTINKTFDSQLGFTVWCSAGEYYDPQKEFDSTWTTMAGANLRAKYLFYWKNCYGLPPDELMDMAAVEKKLSRQGLLTLMVHPDDSQEWTVGVVPDVAFEHLDNATTERHCHDRDYTAATLPTYGYFGY